MKDVLRRFIGTELSVWSIGLMVLRKLKHWLWKHGWWRKSRRPVAVFQEWKNKSEEVQLVGRCRPWACIADDTNTGDEDFKSPRGAGCRVSYESFKWWWVSQKAVTERMTISQCLNLYEWSYLRLLVHCLNLYLPHYSLVSHNGSPCLVTFSCSNVPIIPQRILPF